MSDRPSPDDPTIGRLVADASRDISSLVTKEIELAKSELKVSVNAGGIGIAFFAGAAFLVLLGVIMLSVAIAYFIHWTGLGLHWSFLIVFVLYLLLAGAARLPRLPQGQAGQGARAGHRAGPGDPQGAEGPGLAGASPYCRRTPRSTRSRRRRWTSTAGRRRPPGRPGPAVSA